MTDMPPDNGILWHVRRGVSRIVWTIWDRLPVSAFDRRSALDFACHHLHFLVFWTATYRNWKAEAERRAVQLAWIAEYGQNNRADAFPRYVELSALPRPKRLMARAIAFYLPQFHPIPENDAWWGKGFTEWTNVRRARPQFQGHQQPRRPGELGYYDLLADPAIRRRQAALAHQYGLEGFCFYFYWFGGKRLLEGPVRAFAEDEEISLPFCLCWANESWSRRWDGREDEKLISQQHSPEDDIAFIEHVATYLRSEKYIRIGGKPLLIVYRPDLLPDPTATAARWRQWCRQAGLGEIYLAYTLSFTTDRPEAYGFDAAIEFPPNNMGLVPLEGCTEPLSKAYSCSVYDLSELGERSETYPQPEFTLLRGITPQWDNTARRMNRAAVLLDGGPPAFGRWLRNAARQAAENSRVPDERLVFINAWNEWAEGAYLEPDLDRGYAWLEAMRDALRPEGDIQIEPGDLVPTAPITLPADRPKIITVVHDLHRHGAQIHSLHLVAAFREKFGCDVVTIACDDGPLLRNFETYGPVILLPKRSATTDHIDAALRNLTQEGYRHAIINSAASGWIVPVLAEAGIVCTGLVHEMPDIIRRMELEDALEAFNRHARQVIFASDIVRNRTAEECLGHSWARSVILPQGHYKAESILHPDEKRETASELQRQLGLPDGTVFVIGVGFGDQRKGVDIFCRWAIEAARRDRRLHFLWLGDLSPEMSTTCEALLADVGDAGAQVHLLGFQSDTGFYYRAASAYALSSREDPYPTTVLEALASGTPAFIVSGTSGLQDLAGHAAIRLLPDAAPDTFAGALTGLLESPAEWTASAEAGIRLVQEGYGFLSFAGDLLRLAGVFQPRISVVIPNYNYARFLPHRIATVLSQELPVWEIIFLDDASSDDSVRIAENLLKDCGIRYRIVRSEINSGSVFAQWQKGVDLACGDLIWIAEADDWASARFTKVAARVFADPDVVLSYTQSNQVNQQSEILCPHYLDYVADIDRERWRQSFMNDGARELNEALSIKNTIPNVSGALFRRDALAATLRDHMDEIRAYRVAGDWCTYAHLAALGKIAFDPRPLNYHRRHAGSVTISRFTQAEWDEIARMQARVRTLAEVHPDNAAKAGAYLEELRKQL